MKNKNVSLVCIKVATSFFLCGALGASYASCPPASNGSLACSKGGVQQCSSELNASQTSQTLPLACSDDRLMLWKQYGCYAYENNQGTKVLKYYDKCQGVDKVGIAVDLSFAPFKSKSISYTASTPQSFYVEYCCFIPS
jgi:hypothetical protein